MNLQELREYCLAKPGVEETTPFGPDTLVFKVVGKVFLLTGFEYSPVQFNAKCDPEKAIELRERYDCVQPGYHMNKKHWNTILVDGSVAVKLVKEWIDDSYDLVVEGLSKNEKLLLGKSIIGDKKAAVKKAAVAVKKVSGKKKKAAVKKAASRKK